MASRNAGLPDGYDSLAGEGQSQPSATYLKAFPSRLMWPAAKCPPMTRVGLSAKRENNCARVAVDCAGSESANLVGQLRVARNQLGLAGIDDRLHGVVEDSRLARLVAMVAPVLVLDPASVGCADIVFLLGKCAASAGGEQNDDGRKRRRATAAVI